MLAFEVSERADQRGDGVRICHRHLGQTGPFQAGLLLGRERPLHVQKKEYVGL